MIIKPSPAVYLSPELNQLYHSPPCSDKVKRWIDEMGDVLKGNMLAGNAIQKSRIPKHYVQEYGVNNLYRYQHAEGYRSCYTLKKVDDVGVCPVIFDIMSHPEYDRMFGYETS